ncbi:lipopolysaccharide biosynthesis protein RfbH [Spirulina sp. 06S082]|uniref:lipopolysaccharide biosynthesis protein RfbH n=1 Tax=Spirulina sp. 06S082 TaxID=3110248 RepID=UPI002B209EF0|nr:lipopolysaccharide biosynthesis protein RfbH [Spirulina sp. 06S082]MEA5468840.1 lipopolysaccharide biosynthesis protein RfbH [Spirulina sp. 06S082]
MSNFFPNLSTFSDRERELRLDVLKAAEKYYQFKFSQQEFIPGETYIPASGKVLDERELFALLDSSLDLWLTTGRYAEKFAKQFAEWIGVKHCLLVNSGSSANLLALSALTSPQLGDRRLVSGDEVITVAAGFPTTVNPIVQNQLIPVFLDIKISTYNIDTSYLEEALSPRTKAIMLAHTLGNPFDLKEILKFAREHNLWVIEDNCDALGSLYEGRKTGTFGHISTFSFYPAHHITMGEGGAVLTNDSHLKKIIESFRDWGRDCWCPPGKDNSCQKRFTWQFGNLPDGYDHKYTYSHIGYNFKMTDMQAAVGCAQLEKLAGFIENRKANFRSFQDKISNLNHLFYLPQTTIASEPSWFGFPLTIKESSTLNRERLITFLEQHKIGTRLLFAGNIVKQPAYQNVKYRIISELKVTDLVMNNTFWLGVYPGISEAAIAYIYKTLELGIKKSFEK